MALLIGDITFITTATISGNLSSTIRELKAFEGTGLVLALANGMLTNNLFKTELPNQITAIDAIAVSELATVTGHDAPKSTSKLVANLKATATGIIEHFQNNASLEVKSNITVDASFWGWLTGLIGIFQTWVPIPMDGGLSLKTALTIYLTTNPIPTSLTSKGNTTTQPTGGIS